ncbi:MAG TPA: DNA repair protein RecN [Jiangellaceae bacterium]|nr:DNA repair protein RecN [Jiangellaceae bacterium]
MFSEIRIRGLGVIEDAQLDLGPGLTVLTGETGAGKTMVLTGLGLLMGGRADPGAVRAGADRALIEGRVRVPPAGRIAERVAEAGAELDDGDLLLSRTVSAEGRSRAHVGGRSVPVGVLAELSADLVAVHGQSDQHRLLRGDQQRAALDRFAGEAAAKPMAVYAERFDRLRAVEAELTEVTTQSRERAREADLLRLGLEEIERIGPQPGEDASLASEEDRLAHADGLRTAAEAAHECLTAEESGPDVVDALGLVARARQALETQQDHDSELGQLANRLAEAAYLLADVAADLASYAARVDTDPERLAFVQQRRSDLSGLTRKYGESIDEVLKWADHASRRLLELAGDDDRILALRQERDRLRTELAELAARLSVARTEAADRFAEAVGHELSALAMPHARVVIPISQRPDPNGLSIAGRDVAFGRTGVDDVEMLFSAHAGAEPRPIDKGASGGELSRLMLAIEVVFAGADPVPTFVFDEVDAGVGGAAAVEVGRRLARLARTAQVLVVTHLPQVAAFADRHLRVVKSDDGKITSSGVGALDPEGRIRELSRMLAGLEGSATAKAHAIELLATAADARTTSARPS